MLIPSQELWQAHPATTTHIIRHNVQLAFGEKQEYTALSHETLNKEMRHHVGALKKGTPD